MVLKVHKKHATDLGFWLLGGVEVELPMQIQGIDMDTTASRAGLGSLQFQGFGAKGLKVMENLGQGLGFWVLSFGFWVWGLGFRVQVPMKRRIHLGLLVPFFCDGHERTWSK